MSPFKPYASGSFIFARTELKLHFSYVFNKSYQKYIARLKALYIKKSFGGGHEEKGSQLASSCATSRFGITSGLYYGCALNSTPSSIVANFFFEWTMISRFGICPLPR
jgi:hypothetical protein